MTDTSIRMKKSIKTSDVPGYKEAVEFSNSWNKSLNDFRKKHGLSIKDMVALSQGNDPFWMTPGKVLKAQWAFHIMESIVKPHILRIGETDIHLRDIHYILTGMSQLTWNGSEVYQNTEAHWDDVIKGFANARYLDLVDPELIKDNKNKHEIRTKYRPDSGIISRVKYGKGDLTNKGVLDLFISWFSGLKNWQNHMPVHIELWAEKDLALLDQIAEKYDVNTVTGEGEISITQVYQIINRIKKAGKPVRIGYVSDCDVVGSNMSKAMARKMEFIIHSLEESDFDVKLTHLMLTPTQVNQYGLPTIPMKAAKPDSKSKSYETRKDEWMKSRGLPGAVEINSFHALYPDNFRNILENFILSYFDADIRDEIISFNEEQSNNIRELISNDKKINTLLEKSLTSLKGVIDKINWKEKEENYDVEFTEVIDACGDLDYSERDEHYQWLLDTDLAYGEQLARYNEYESGNLDNPEESG